MRILLAVTILLAVFYTSLLVSSQPLDGEQRAAVDRAIDLLAAKGFDREVFLLRVARFRSSDHWLNRLAGSDQSFASTNFPFQIVTINPDFYTIPRDDTERAIVLLHEARHLQGGSEVDAYKYVWLNRHRLGWNHETYYIRPSYSTTEGETRIHAPDLFTCPQNPRNDCTEN